MPTSNVSRREVLNYLLLGSGAMMGVGSLASMLWFANPPYRPGTPESLVRFDRLQPTTHQWLPEARAFLVQLETGIVALSALCTTRGETWVKWVSINNRFECPWCGAKFALDGSYINGPARRNLDHLYMRVFTSDGTIEVDSLEDSFIGDITSIWEIWIDRERVFLGRAREA